MRIMQVDLEHVKSYDQASVAFTVGTNAICGHNGAGKSTVLEAIGFALFDFLATRQDDFVREGENTATVTVHVEGGDGRAYEVVRRCGSSSQYYVYDPELGQKLTDGKGETVAWLYDFLGVEAATDLTALFRDAVGVPQGLLTAAFLETPSQRKNVFNPLLRVDEYERVWHDLRVPRRELDRQITDLEREMAGFAAQTEALPGLQDRAENLELEILTAQEQQASVSDALGAVTQDAATLEAVKARLAALDAAVAEAEAQVTAVAARRDAAQEALGRAEAAAAVVAETEDAHAAYRAAQEALAALEEQRDARDRLQARRRDADKDLALARQRLESLAVELDAVTEAQQALDALRPQVERQTALEEALVEAQRAADRLAAAEQSLVQERRRHSDLAARLAAVQADLQARVEVAAAQAAAQAALEDLDARHQALTEAVATQREEQARAREQAQQAESRVAQLAADLAQAEANLATVERQLSELQADLETRSALEDQGAEARAALDAGIARLEALTARVAAGEAELDAVRARLAALETAEDETAQCPVCDRPLTPEHRDELLARNRERCAELEAAVDEDRAARAEAEAARGVQQDALDALEARLRRLPRPEEAEALQARVAEQRRALDERRAQAAQAREVQEAAEARAAASEAELAELAAQQATVAEEQAARREALRAHTERLAALPRPAEADELASQLADQAQAVDAAAATCEALRDAPQEVARLTEELAALGDPRQDFRRAADVVAQRETLTAQRAEAQERRAALERRLAELDEELAAYAELDAQIAAERAAQAEHEPDHHRYLAHRREAEALAERRATVDALEAEVAEAQAQRAARAAERATVAEDYDADRHNELNDRRAALQAELAALEERLRQQSRQLAEAQDEIARLEAVAAQLDAARADRDELARMLALLEHLRAVLRDAGPEVTRALVELISLHADRLYADIMQQHRARLRWTEDYDIVLSTDGRERTFQQLSGGEQMAAALAVRLALLRETSTIDVAFFDEPTANLDAARRANLARQILNVKGFSQLFVISHDDTFEQDTDHVVRVAKVDGVTQVLE